ncbi:MAG: N-acetylglutaminylglutamine synthetase [Myxococcales bacterium]|nr:N-acetylglutaminylglutamine synthetase [Myxococcales bacterium]MCB9578703.1 N-acetylglutaminylglutamine synthetase [Polyangiaceae bacterium]
MATQRRRRAAFSHRIDRDHSPTLAAWKHPPQAAARHARNVALECGWGRLIFGHTFESNEEIADTLREERSGRRDIALYLADPHVVLSIAPHELFLDPSHTFRMYLEQFRPPTAQPQGFVVRRLQDRSDAAATGRVYSRRHMVPVDPEFIWSRRLSRELTYLVAEDTASGEIIGTVTGVDHVEAFGDRENGSSLWALAVDPQTTHPGVGQALVTHLLEHYIARGRSFLDLSVMHDNKQAIRLYEKLGFCRVPVFCVKRKNPINEPLFIADPPTAGLNPYASIIVREAQRRGIAVDVLDVEAGYFALSFGGRTVVCRESLSELTSAVAMSRCDDKRVTRRVLQSAGLNVPAQREAGTPEDDQKFLELYGRIVVKPARGEQGAGVSVDVRTGEELARAIEGAATSGSAVILEEMVAGEDLRIIVIDAHVVAAAIRRPPEVTGTGEHTIRQLIEKQSRRRAAATGGESRIPLDAETERCVAAAGYDLDSVLPPGKPLRVRKAANLHGGGTIHDVTAELHPRLIQAAVRAAEALDIPVVGLDFIVPATDEPRYWIIEANERPGLANHEPQPTAERFVDLLFPQTAT